MGKAGNGLRKEDKKWGGGKGLVWLTRERHMLDAPKTKASKRKIPMLSQAYDILSEMKRQADNKEMGNADNFVFCLPDGSELSRSRVEIQLEMTKKHML